MQTIDYQTLRSAADQYQTRSGIEWRDARVREFTGGVSSRLADVPFAQRRALFDAFTQAVTEFDARRGK